MQVQTERVFRMRQFRVALVAIVAWPWLVGVVVALVTGSAPSARWLGPLLIDVILVIASLRKPWGLAPMFIVGRFVIGALAYLLPHGAAWWWALICAVQAAALAWLLLPIWKERGILRMERDSGHRARVDRAYEDGDRRSSARRTERELRRAGLDVE